MNPDTSAQFFDAMFQRSNDPWDFATSDYEQFRYRTVLNALVPGPYRYAFEPGCSVGVLTEKLAGICERVDACDFSSAAVKQARMRCRILPGVSVRQASLTDAAAYSEYDLVVFSEIGYYFSSAEWKRLIATAVAAMQPGTTLLASHWLGRSPDHVLSGDEVHSLIDNPELQHEHGERHPNAEHGGFRLDRWKKR
ncbi:MAG: SAM-dependent methyltransferase [Janthinobacterium lividum]